VKDRDRKNKKGILWPLVSKFNFNLIYKAHNVDKKLAESQAKHAKSEAEVNLQKVLWPTLLHTGIL